MAALFCALAIASTYIMHIKVMFLTFDAKDAVITIAGLLFGPIYSIAISLIVSLVEFITIGDAGFWGFLMDFLSTAIYSTVCALIYKYKKNIKGAAIGLVFLPFNLTKATLNAAIVLILYKPVSTALKAARVLPSSAKFEESRVASEQKKKKNLIFSLVVTAVGLAIAALCFVVFFVFLHGQIAFG